VRGARRAAQGRRRRRRRRSPCRTRAGGGRGQRIERQRASRASFLPPTGSLLDVTVGETVGETGTRHIGVRVNGLVLLGRGAQSGEMSCGELQGARPVCCQEGLEGGNRDLHAAAGGVSGRWSAGSACPGPAPGREHGERRSGWDDLCLPCSKHVRHLRLGARGRRRLLCWAGEGVVGNGLSWWVSWNGTRAAHASSHWRRTFSRTAPSAGVAPKAACSVRAFFAGGLGPASSF